MSNDVVKLAGFQRVGGIKDFNQFPLTPKTSPSSNYQVANKKYVDDNAGSGTMFTLVEIGAGATNQDGNWRFTISGGNLLVQERRAGVWTTVSTFS